MSGYLWKYYLQDDVESFRQLLESSAFAGRASLGKSHGSQIGLGVVGPGSFGASPNVSIKGRKRDEPLANAATSAAGNVTLTRADINRKDASGRTLLHLAASSDSENAFAFATALLDHSLTDLYVQDHESGWTALHRAFYAGNISIACAILNRDAQDALGSTAAGFLAHSLGLVKVKDREGNGPLDLFTSTVDSDRHAMSAVHNTAGDDSADDDEERQAQMPQNDDDDSGARVASLNLRGDEVFTFGSNRNVTLGFGDQDDRQFPERIVLRRPDHLLNRFYAEHLEMRAKSKRGPDAPFDDLALSQSLHLRPASSLPAVIRNRPIIIKDVHMARLDTAILTTDPESNLHMCGHGKGGRLGTGDERTRYQFVCIEGGALSGKHIATVALGSNHTLAVSGDGDIFSWGNNNFGQLGYVLPKPAAGDEDPVQLLPRQIYGLLKREIIIGVAASSMHSVAYTASSLFTFGKNEGQLGIVDSDARSLESQATPRRVAASMFSGNIASVVAIDRATICLLDTHEVYVFANYGYAKVSFALDSFASPFSQQSFTATRYEATPNQICKITAGGNTICAMSSAGEVFTITVNQPTELVQNTTTSTTNPSKIRGALSQAHRIWDLRKGHMAARDVGVDQDGSIILTTDEGSVWRRTRRAKIQSSASTNQYKAKDYKYSRIPGLTRAIAVRSSAFGAYAAIRRDCEATRAQIEVDGPTLWKDFFRLLPFRELAEVTEDSDDENPTPRFWNKPSALDNIRRRTIGDVDTEAEVQQILDRQVSSQLPCNLNIKTSTSDVVLPLHSFILTARSRPARSGLSHYEDESEWTVADLLSVSHGTNASPTITFKGVDFLTILNLVLYLYTDLVIDFWLHTRDHPKMAPRYRTVRAELLKIATALELSDLERAVRLQVLPKLSMNLDMELAIKDEHFFESGDVSVQLADADMLVHSAVICRRCPFFEGLFIGRTGGRWLSDRADVQRDSNVVEVDLKHVQSSTFILVLRHIYADTGSELFDEIMSENLDAFLDVVIEVMSVANELMLERLSQICQEMVGKYTTVRNVCQLLNAIAPCSVTEFKDKGLEYICLNLEALLAQGLLNDLDEDVLFELDDVVRTVQLRCSEVTRSGVREDELHEAHPELSDLIEAERHAKIDYMMMQSRHFSTDRVGSLAVDAFRENFDTPGVKSPRVKGKARASLGLMPNSPTLIRKKSAGDFMFDMDEDGDDVPPMSLRRESVSRNHHRRPSGGYATSPLPDQEQWYDSRGKKLPSPSQSLSPSMRRTPIGSPAVATTSPRMRPADGSSPWAPSPMAAKLGIKDIMAQASSSRASSLSMAISGQSTERPRLEFQAGNSSQGKQSQKERKKSQQAQSRSAPDIPLVPATPSPSNVKSASPWQIVARPKSSIKETMKASSRSASPSPAVVRNITAPPMTMRQTVAGNASSSKQKVTETVESPRAESIGHRPSPARSTGPSTQSTYPTSPASGPQRMPATPQRPQVTPIKPTSSNNTPSIQSIRHIPKPQQESIIGLSLADILSEQQAEKTAIHDAVTAKRSLQEIQQEQEFQQWWDLESRRVMEEEQMRTTQSARRGRGGSRGGARRGKKVAAAGGKSGAAAGDDTPTRTTADDLPGARDGGRPAGRADHRGRGKVKSGGQDIGPSKQ